MLPCYDEMTPIEEVEHLCWEFDQEFIKAYSSVEERKFVFRYAEFASLMDYCLKKFENGDESQSLCEVMDALIPRVKGFEREVKRRFHGETAVRVKKLINDICAEINGFRRVIQALIGVERQTGRDMTFTRMREYVLSHETAVYPNFTRSLCRILRACHSYDVSAEFPRGAGMETLLAGRFD